MKNNTQAESNPYKYSYGTNKRYRTFDGYIKERFGGKCAKITLDGGFTCPNIDGRAGRGGCLFCSMPSSREREVRSFAEQYEIKKAAADEKWRGARNISYLSDYSGSYADVGRLRAVYEEALSLPDTVGLFVGTRPDCLSDEIIDLMAELSKKTFFVCEVGVETLCDKTLTEMNRGHNALCSVTAFERLHAAGILTCPHIIFGLPGESGERMLQTVREVAALFPEFIKIHMLYIERGSALCERYIKEPFSLLTKEEYVSLVCDALRLLPEDTVVERLTGDGIQGKLLQPEWSRKKVSVINDIDKEMYRRGAVQGDLFGE